MRALHPDRLLALAIVAPLSAFAAYGMLSLPSTIAHWSVPLATVPILLGWLAIVALPIMLWRSGRPRSAAAAAIGGLLALRVLVALAAVGRIPPGDADMYLVLADHLREGRGLEIVEPYMGVETYALFPPLYPMLLAAWGLAVGTSTAALTVLGLVIDGTAAALIATLGRTLGHARAGVVAAWLYVMWPSVLLSAPLAQKEGLCALLALVLALQWLRLVRAARPGLREAAAIGIAAGLLALTQPGELPLAALFGIVALGTGVRRLFIVAIAAVPAAAAAVMLPWWVRNAVLFHSFVPLTSAGGYGLWIGNNPDANGHWLRPPIQLHGLAEIPFGKAAARLAVMWIEGHPVAFMRVTVAKALRGWGIAEFGASRFAQMRPAAPGIIAGVMFVMTQLFHFALLGAGLVATRMRRTPGARMLLLLVLACLLQTLCFGVFFEFGERHRDFATPFLLLLAAFGLPRSEREPA
jgi:hypothetical protein